MNILDIILVIPLLWALYRGFKKGLVYMIASLTALVLGVLGAMRFHDEAAGMLTKWFEINPAQLNLIAFASTFVLIVLIVHLAAFLLDKLLKAVALNFVNRAAGMVFGLLVTAFIVSIILQPIDAANSKSEFISKDTKEGSLLYKPLCSLAPLVFPYLKKDSFREMLPIDKKSEETEEDGASA